MQICSYQICTTCHATFGSTFSLNPHGRLQILVLTHNLWVRTQVTQLPLFVSQFRTLSMAPQGRPHHVAAAVSPLLPVSVPAGGSTHRPPDEPSVRCWISLACYPTGLLTTVSKSHRTSLPLPLFSASLLYGRVSGRHVLIIPSGNAIHDWLWQLSWAALETLTFNNSVSLGNASSKSLLEALGNQAGL